MFIRAHNDMRIAQEEIFGPVLTVITYKTEAEAIRIANDSTYGLGGGVVAGSTARGFNVARQDPGRKRLRADRWITDRQCRCSGQLRSWLVGRAAQRRGHHGSLRRI
jgi:hypothetical protein